MALLDPTHYYVPPGMEGVSLGGYEPIVTGIARASLQAASLALLERVGFPAELQLEYTPAGSDEPYLSPPMGSAQWMSHFWMSDTPAVSAGRLYTRDTYVFDANIPGATPRGVKTVDKLSYYVVLPGKNVPGGALAISGLTRFYEATPHGRRPDLFDHVIMNRAARTLQRFTRRTKDATGNSWQWRIINDEDTARA